MTIQEHIKSIAQQMGIAYIYHNWTSVNQAVSTSKLPVMINVLPVSGSFSVGYELIERTNCMVAFLDKTDYDFDAEENDQIVERMKNLAKQFLVRLNKVADIENLNLDEVPYQVVYDKLDANLTGIILDLRISKSEGMCQNTNKNDEA